MRPLAALIVLAGAAAGAFLLLDGAAGLGWIEREPDRLTLYGNVDIRQVQLGFGVAGRLAETLVDEGDRVVEGQVLARLATDILKPAVMRAQAEADGRRAALAKLEAGPRPAEIAQARARLAERRADLANARQAHERAAALQVSGASSAAALDRATAARDMAAAREHSVREELRLLEEGSRPEDVAVARAEVDAAEAALSTARSMLNDADLRAPSDGIVLSRVREAGAIVTPSDTVLAIALTGPALVRSYVPEPFLGKIAPGTRVEVTSDSAPDQPYSGTIGFVSPVAEFTPKSVETPELRTDLVYRFRVVIDPGSDGLRQGMPVTIRLPQSEGHGS